MFHTTIEDEIFQMMRFTRPICEQKNFEDQWHAKLSVFFFFLMEINVFFNFHIQYIKIIYKFNS